MKIHNFVLDTFLLLMIAGNIHAASFDCGKASSEVEKIICSDEELSKLDESLSEAYLQALKRAYIKRQAIESQRKWLKNHRNTCQNAECLKRAYETRIKELGLPSSDGIATLTTPDRSTSPPKALPKVLRSQAIQPPDEAIQIRTVPHHESTLKRLRKSEAEPSLNEQLLQAAENGRPEQVNTLLTKGGEVNARDKNGQTALMAAAGMGHREIVKLLIDKGADVNATDENGRTVLMDAAMAGKLQIVEFSNDKGLDVNAKPEGVETALMAAEWGGNLAVVRLLIDKGADVHARAKNGDTALKMAKNKGNTQIVKLLKAHGAEE
jgi:uncharacterized protein